MDEQPEQEKEQSEINKIDLSALQGFSFGTQWTPAEKVSPSRREGRDREHQGSRDFPGGPRAPRDRRPARKFSGDAPPVPQTPGAPAQTVDRRPGGSPRQQYSSDNRDRRDRAPVQLDNRPYQSTVFDVVFYPEDEVFHKIVQRVRDSKHTFELFEIARAVLGKSERCVIVVRRKPDSGGNQAPVHVSAPDGVPFETEDAAVDHVIRLHLGSFFTVEEVELEAPKGSFAVISKCGFTGELLGPPNYHRYQNILQQHHASRLAHMSFDRFKDRLESVREPEAIAAWQEKMKKGTRYTWKTPAAGAETPVFEAIEDARNYLLTNARDQVVRQLEHARFHGKVLETIPEGEIRRAIDGQLERQRRFPLDSANALRGRLRREGFTIFKKGSKGVSYVCAVKRKFRVLGQTFSDSINGLIDFIEANPMLSIREVPVKMLGIEMPAPAQPGQPPVEGAKQLTPEEDAKLRRMLTDLRWLVTEGYVTEYSDGRLFAPPPARQNAPRDDESGGDDEESSEEVSSESGETAGTAGTAPVEETAAVSEEAPAESAPAASVEEPSSASVAPESEAEKQDPPAGA